MFSLEVAFQVRQEQIKDELRDLEQQNLIKLAAAQQRDRGGPYLKAVNWLGSQMVKWGLKMQSYDPAIKTKIRFT